MAPERQSVGLGRNVTRKISCQENEWPLSPRVVRQIQRDVARKGRSLQRLEVHGAVIDNFDALGPLSPQSPTDNPQSSFVKIERAASPLRPMLPRAQPGVMNLLGPLSPQSPTDHPQSSFVKIEGATSPMRQMASRTQSGVTMNLVKRESEYYEDESVGRDSPNNAEDGLIEDNDLTNLTWLQDSNLIRSINLTKGENDELRPAPVQISPQSMISGASPTSDYLEDSFTSEPADSCSSDQQLLSPCVSPTLQTPVKNMIPSGYIASAKSSNNSASKLKHPHNVPYNPLVHTQNKPPYSFSCLIFMAIEDSPKKALPVKDIYSWILEHFPYFRNAPTGWKNSVRHNLSLNKCFIKVEKVQSLGKGSLWMVDGNYRSNLLQAFSRSPFHPCCPTLRSPSPSRPTTPVIPDSLQERVLTSDSNGAKGAPNPELFPYLSRRLAASNKSLNDSIKEAISDHDSCDSLDEVVAAAMVLALKHGPGVLRPPLISSCPTQDHTYSAATGSPETGYGSDEEQRRTAEALLHLAGLPPAPESNNEESHKPRLLRRAPKRPIPSSMAMTDPEHQMSLNNNCGSQADRNLLRMKRPRMHPL